MWALALGLALLLMVQCCKAETEWKTCGPGDFKVTAVDLDPARPSPGSTAKFSLDIIGGSSEVTSGSLSMLVRLSGLPIYTQQDDLCAKTTCPIVAGSAASIVYSQDFPVYTPPGSYDLTITGGSGSEQLFCVDITFTVGYGGAVLLHRKAVAS